MDQLIHFWSQIVTPLGGLGLFLLGMVILTDGLKLLSGRQMRSILVRFTRTPFTGMLGGFAATAVLQSSSVITVAAVGFVSAGLISFTESIGIILGANLGTTVTGWLVMLLGYKLNLGMIMLPLIFFGVMLRLFGRERMQAIGYALSGLGLLFVGLSMMQEGMEGLKENFSFDGLSAQTWLNRIYLIGFGLLITLVIQSSSAGVAALLGGLYSGLIQFDQAAFLLIGMEIGTTATAMMSSIGGTVDARRTATSHLLYNTIMAGITLFCVAPYIHLWEWLQSGSLQANPGIALVTFHTASRVLGILIFLPAVRPFARLIERLIVDNQPSLSRVLDLSLLSQPALALQVLQTTVFTQTQILFAHLAAILGNSDQGHRADIKALGRSIDESQVYMDQIHLSPHQGDQWSRLIEIVHALDHMQRLQERCSEEEYRAQIATTTPNLQSATQLLLSTTLTVLEKSGKGEWQEAAKLASETVEKIHAEMSDYRQSVIQALAQGDIDAITATARLESIRWLSRVGRHVARISLHLGNACLMPA